MWLADIPNSVMDRFPLAIRWWISQNYTVLSLQKLGGDGVFKWTSDTQRNRVIQVLEYISLEHSGFPQGTVFGRSVNFGITLIGDTRDGARSTERSVAWYGLLTNRILFIMKKQTLGHFPAMLLSVALSAQKAAVSAITWRHHSYFNRLSAALGY